MKLKDSFHSGSIKKCGFFSQNKSRCKLEFLLAFIRVKYVIRWWFVIISCRLVTTTCHGWSTSCMRRGVSKARLCRGACTLGVLRGSLWVGRVPCRVLVRWWVLVRRILVWRILVGLRPLSLGWCCSRLCCWVLYVCRRNYSMHWWLNHSPPTPSTTQIYTCHDDNDAEYGEPTSVVVSVTHIRSSCIPIMTRLPVLDT